MYAYCLMANHVHLLLGPGEEDCWIDPDPAYPDLAHREADRRALYARFVEQGVPEQELTLMREALQRGQLTGNPRFVDEVELGDRPGGWPPAGVVFTRWWSGPGVLWERARPRMTDV